MATLLKDLGVKAAVQHNEMSSCPVITDTMSANDDDISMSSSADVLLAPPAHQLKPDCNVEQERSGAVAPPLTARNAQNPTVERNTHCGSSEELAVEGNTLVPRRAANHAPADATVAAASQPDASQSSRRITALRPDQLHRISYLQNVVDGAVPTGVAAAAPKRQNVEAQARRPCEMNCGDDKCKGCACSKSADDGDDDDGDASRNTSSTTTAAAGDNLGYESSASPSSEAAPTSIDVSSSLPVV